MFAGLLATMLNSLENIDFLVLSLECPWLSCGSLLCRVLKLTYSGHIWQQKIQWLWKDISVATLCVLSKPPSRWRCWEHWAPPRLLLGRPPGTTQQGAEPCPLPALCPFPRGAKQSLILHSGSVFSQEFLVPGRHGCGKGSAACASARGAGKQSYQNEAFSYKLQVLKIHVIIVLSGSKCAYDAERGQIGLGLKQALPFS